MKLKRNFFLLLFFIGSRAFCQTPVWTQSQNYPGSTSRNDDIHFIDEHTGWAAAGATGQIYKTTDGGKNWVLQYTNPNAHFRSLAFVSAERGFIGNLGPGSYDTASSLTDTNVLYQTTNGGVNWSVVPGLSEQGMRGFCAFHVLDSQHIYGGGRVRGPAYFVKTENAGTNWAVVNVGVTNGGQNVMGGIMDVYFKDATNGFLVGMDTNSYYSGFYNGCIAKTTNGGANWFPVLVTSNITTCYFWKMSWPAPDIGYVTLQKNPIWNGTVVFFKTIDGGNTWTSNSIPLAPMGLSSFYTQGIGFVNTNEGWIGGDGNTSPYTNNFLHTIDGGATWSPAGYTDTRRINRIRFLNPNFGYAAGFKLHIFRIPLAITLQPQSQTNVAGTNVTLNVAAQGTPPLGFQWRFGGANIAGANTNVYSITNFQATNAGNYDVVVSDSSGSTTSAIATLTLNGSPSAPMISLQPQSQTILQNSNATFTVNATGTAPISYQWQFNGNNLSGATQTSYTRTNAQMQDAGNYFAIVTNSGGSVTSSVAVLTIVQTNVLFSENFESYNSPLVVTNAGTTNNYKFFYRATTGPIDFKAIFGFDYSSVNYPTNIPPAPDAIGGTTKGLFLTVNKDATTNLAAVNLYPTNQSFSGNFALKFNMWINWANPSTSTEHVMFGINHSGNVTNRVTQTPSDGLFFEVDGEGGSTSSSTELRDFSVLRGGGASAPILMLTNNTEFGPSPVLGSQFDNTNPGFVSLFPAQTIPGYGITPSGTAGLRWIRAEVRQENNLITWLLNGIAVAQYTNSSIYTNGTFMLGYNDQFTSIGDSNNFVVFDNLRVEPIIFSPVTLLSPRVTENGFNFDFASEAYETYTIQSATNLIAPSWTTYTNVVGNGVLNTIQIPLANNEKYFRVTRP